MSILIQLQKITMTFGATANSMGSSCEEMVVCNSDTWGRGNNKTPKK